jgi:hypothetical protein
LLLSRQGESGLWALVSGVVLAFVVAVLAVVIGFVMTRTRLSDF